MSSELHYLGLTEVAALIQDGELSPVELTRHMLERIDSVDQSLKSYATVCADRAMADAERAERKLAAGEYLGPLHGIPVALKDLIDTRGVRTMGGLKVRRDHVPETDATVTRRLEQAGAVLLGKLNLTEGAMAGYHPEFDIPVNPWDPQYWSGASSSGSGVAPAAGLCYAALGSDTGGSIRFPAMANGVVGLKPTYGRVSRQGVLPLGETLDHIGPLTRRVADSAAVLSAIAGSDPEDPSTLEDPVTDWLGECGANVAGLRVGVDRELLQRDSAAGLVEAIELALQTLQDLGVEVIELRLPEDTAEVGDIWMPLCACEAHNAHSEYYPEHAADYGPFFGDFLALGSTITEEQYAALTVQRDDYSRRFEAVLAEVDAMVCPAGGSSFPVSHDLLYGDAEAMEPLFAAVQMYFTIPADFAGTPSLTLPCGQAESGIPHSMQLMGSKLSEGTLCRLGAAYERASEWHRLHPPL